MARPRVHIILDITDHSTVLACSRDCPTNWRTCGDSARECFTALWLHLAAVQHGENTVRVAKKRAREHNVPVPSWWEDLLADSVSARLESLKRNDYVFRTPTALPALLGAGDSGPTGIR